MTSVIHSRHSRCRALAALICVGFTRKWSTVVGGGGKSAHAVAGGGASSAGGAVCANAAEACAITKVATNQTRITSP